MPKSAVSNIALPAYDHEAELGRLRDLGMEGLEVAPSRVWRDTWHGLTAADVSTYRHAVETAGLRVVGLHSLFFDQPGLGLFKAPEIRRQSLDFLEHLSGVCRDLGGRTLIYGSAPARRRGDLPLEDAYAEAIGFFGDLSRRVEDHGTCFCFEPLGPDEADFINSAFDALNVVEAVNHPPCACSWTPRRWWRTVRPRSIPSVLRHRTWSISTPTSLTSAFLAQPAWLTTPSSGVFFAKSGMGDSSRSSNAW